MYKIFFENQALKDAKKIEQSNLKENVAKLLAIIKINPFKYPPKFKILTKDYAGSYSRRINKKHRLVYQVSEELKQVKIIRMWGHYVF